MGARCCLQRATTDLVAEPPRLLRTVMLCGLTDTLNSLLYLPPPLFVSVPISCPLDVTKTCSVAVERVLVASTRSMRLSVSYSARVIVTVSVDVEDTELIVSVAVRVTPLSVALIVALVVEVTVVVLMLKVADVAPAATVTLAGTEARALLLARLTVVAAGAVALKVTLP